MASAVEGHRKGSGMNHQMNGVVMKKAGGRPASAATAPHSVVIQVPQEIRAFFTEQDMSGHGGFQTLGRMLAERLQNTTKLALTSDEFRRVVRYATLYGDGGFQQRLRKIIAHWVQQHMNQLIGE